MSKVDSTSFLMDGKHFSPLNFILTIGHRSKKCGKKSHQTEWHKGWHLPDRLKRQLAEPSKSSNTLPHCDEFPEEVCGCPALKAARFLPVCALLITLASLGPQLLNSFSFTLLFSGPHSVFLNKAPTANSSHLSLFSSCSFGLLSICPFFKGSFALFILISYTNPEGRAERWQLRREGDRRNCFIWVMALCYWGKAFDGWLLGSHWQCLINKWTIPNGTLFPADVALLHIKEHYFLATSPAFDRKRSLQDLKSWRKKELPKYDFHDASLANKKIPIGCSGSVLYLLYILHYIGRSE